MGLAIFILLFGGNILQPDNIAWILRRNDPAVHFIGWHFFRNEPWHLPLGLSWAYGMEMGSSIVFTDSIPLLAFILKPFSDYLSMPFQYTGIWILVCFALQGMFGWLLLQKLTKNKILSAIGSLFFIFSPIVLARTSHYSLIGHWVILASLYLYFTHSASQEIKWASLLVVVSLINAYLLVMTAAIWLASIFKTILRNEKAISVMIGKNILVLALVTFAMWISGYFVLQQGHADFGGFGFYRMNLLSLIDPGKSETKMWSYLLPDLPQGRGDYEGFNYLGLGIIILVVVSIYKFFKSFHPAFSWRYIGPLAVVCLLLTFYSISNRVALGNNVLLSLDLPKVLMPLFESFRGSGRFFWPVYYLIYMVIFYCIISSNSSRGAVIILGTALIIQVADTSKGWRFYWDNFSNDIYQYDSPLKSQFWNVAAKKYNKVLFVLPEYLAQNWLPISYYAGSNKMAINAGYFCRIDMPKLMETQNKILASVVNGEFDNDALYIFNDKYLLGKAQAKLGLRDWSGNVDGFSVLAPGWFNCTRCLVQ